MVKSCQLILFDLPAFPATLILEDQNDVWRSIGDDSGAKQLGLSRGRHCFDDVAGHVRRGAKSDWLKKDGNYAKTSITTRASAAMASSRGCAVHCRILCLSIIIYGGEALALKSPFSAAFE